MDHAEQQGTDPIGEKKASTLKHAGGRRNGPSIIITSAPGAPLPLLSTIPLIHINGLPLLGRNMQRGTVRPLREDEP